MKSNDFNARRFVSALFAAFVLFAVCASVPAQAQVASNPPYVLEQSVVAAGGGQSSAGGAFALAGTIGQPIAGIRLTGSGFSVAGGFWTPTALVPTAATVTIGGRVLTMDGTGLRNARVTLTDASGNSSAVLSGIRGAFRFAEVEAGRTYIIAVQSRRYIFQPQVVFVNEDISNLNFTAAAGQIQLGF